MKTNKRRKLKKKVFIFTLKSKKKKAWHILFNKYNFIATLPHIFSFPPSSDCPSNGREIPTL